MPVHDGHHHGHDHADHGHTPASFGRAFAIGTTLNAGFVAVQVFYGLAAHSMALLADAVHNLGDVLGLIAAWGAASMARRDPTVFRTYGWGRGTILAALTNAVMLLFGCGAIAIEALRRFASPAPVGATTVMWVAALGILINSGTALGFARGRRGDLNIRGAFLHMASDAAVSAGVVFSAWLIAITGAVWLDAATSLAIVAIITIGTWSLLRDSVNLAMDTVPSGIDLGRVDALLGGLPGVIEVHDLHVWALSTTQTALTAHLVRESGADDDQLIATGCATLRERFGIGHVTLQLETPGHAGACRLRPPSVV